jgi:hypothetical protein
MSKAASSDFNLIVVFLPVGFDIDSDWLLSYFVNVKLSVTGLKRIPEK